MAPPTHDPSWFAAALDAGWLNSPLARRYNACIDRLHRLTAQGAPRADLWRGPEARGWGPAPVKKSANGRRGRHGHRDSPQARARAPEAEPGRHLDQHEDPGPRARRHRTQRLRAAAGRTVQKSLHQSVRRRGRCRRSRPRERVSRSRGDRSRGPGDGGVGGSEGRGVSPAVVAGRRGSRGRAALRLDRAVGRRPSSSTWRGAANRRPRDRIGTDENARSGPRRLVGTGCPAR